MKSLRNWALRWSLAAVTAFGILAAISGDVQAGEGDDAPNETFFEEPSNFGIVAGPGTKLTTLGFSKFVVISGGGGGVLLFRHLLLQGVNYVLPVVDHPEHDSSELSMSYFGALLGWVLFPRDKLHFVVGATVGQGIAEVSPKANHELEQSLTYFLLEPFGEVEASLYKGIRVYAGGNWRIMMGSDSAQGIDGGTLSGPAFEFGFRMGGF